MDTKRSGILTGLIVLLLTTGCFVIENKYTGLAPGLWRGVLKLETVPVTPNPRGEPLPDKVNLKFEEVTEGELPFIFEVLPLPDGRFYIEIHNAEQRLRIDDISFGTERSSAKDTLLIRFQKPGSFIRARFEQNVIEGIWVDESRGPSYSVPFIARYSKDYRFTNLKKPPVADISGKWTLRFSIDTDSPTNATAEFRQDGNNLSAGFRTADGNIDHLDGTIQGDKIYLSSFDGEQAVLIEAKIQQDGRILGAFRSGAHQKSLWEAEKE